LKRKSTRTFKERALTQDEFLKISGYINKSDYKNGIFDSVRFELIKNTNDSIIGEYGEIKGANYYIAAIINNSRESLLDVGYAFETFMLYIESIGLGTCWLASTSFDRNAAELYTPLKENQIIAAITPVGEKASIRSEHDLETRKRYESDKRLNFDEIFIDLKTGGKVENKRMREILESVRLAPSTLNNQPWRVAIDGSVAHFYVIRKFKLPLNYDFQMMDIGVALCHYSAVSGKYTFYMDKPKSYNNLEYIISVK